MRHFIVSTIFLSILLLSATVCGAQELHQQEDAPEERLEVAAPQSQYDARLQHERYQTALAKERAEQARQADRERQYEYQERARQAYAERMDQERRHDQQSDQINTINQAANTVTSIVRQIQVLNGRGW